MSTDAKADAQGEPSYTLLETEKVNPATIEIDCMSPLEIVRVLNAEDAKVAGCGRARSAAYRQGHRGDS